MQIIRKCSDTKMLFPEYFSNRKLDDLVFSKYTYFQKVNQNSFFLFSFVSDAIVRLNIEEYNVILDRNFSEYNHLFIALRENGFFVKKEFDEYDLMLQHRKKMLKSRSTTLKIVIMPTTDCNARCLYCIGKDNYSENMTLATAKKVIDFIVNNSKGYKAIRLDWYGGEPLIKKDIITYICDEVHNALPEINLTSVITTNLVLFDEDLLKTAIHSWHIVKVNITIDGDEIEHNNRKRYLNKKFNGYKHTIKCIKLLLEKGIHVFCRFNIDKKNIENLKEVISDISCYINDKLFYFFVSPLRGSNEFEEFYSTDEYNKLFFETGELLNKLGVKNPVDTFVPKAMKGYCIAKNQNCFVIGPNGLLYRCNLGTLGEDYATGSVFTGLEKNHNFKKYMTYAVDSECQNCNFLPICQGGCPTQKETVSKSNSKCSKFRYKVEAVARLLEIFYV